LDGGLPSLLQLGRGANFCPHPKICPLAKNRQILVEKYRLYGKIISAYHPGINTKTIILK